MNEGEKSVDISSYLREYVRITLTCIRNPGRFFEEIKSEGRKYLKPIAYLLISGIIFYAGFFSWLLFSPEEYSSVKMLFSQQMILFSLIFGSLFMIAYIVPLHLGVRLVGGKGTFNDTLKVVCYSFSPLNFAWVFGPGLVAVMYLKNTLTLLAAVLFSVLFLLAIFASTLYMYYIEVVGLSVTSEITKLKAFIAMIIQFIFYSIIATILSIGVFLFLILSPPYPDSSPASYTSQRYGDDSAYPRIDERNNITVYAGSAPRVDGIVDAHDRWDEGEKLNAQVREKYYTVITKHDFENLYVLIQVNGSENWKDALGMHFEQDGNGHNLDLNTGITDTYMYAADPDGKVLFRDGHFNKTYNDREDQNSFLITGYKYGLWSLEWQIPLRSGDMHDIYVDRYPANIGFALIDWSYGARGIWPRIAQPYSPEGWGNMTIVGERAPFMKEAELYVEDSYIPERKNITAYAGSPPQIDGAVAEDDKWYEGERFIAKDRKRTYYVTIKHDLENIYILMEWKNPYKQSGNMIVFFEQDDGKPDLDLFNGRVDGYVQGHYRDDDSTGQQAPIDNVLDMHHISQGYGNDEHQDGSIRGHYINNKWTLEWKIPMRSGDKDDIYIDRYPTEVGFAITNPIVAQEEGIFPPGSDNHNPQTWGTLLIVDKRMKE